MRRVNYERIYGEICALIEESLSKNDEIESILQNICELLRTEVEHYSWVGFYLADESERTLYLGPYSGEPTEYKRIPYGRGICGQAVEIGDTFVVQDVSQETNYLACSPKVKSEIVVPIYKNGRIVGEIDIDSHYLSAFSEDDRKFLERVADRIAEII